MMIKIDVRVSEDERVAKQLQPEQRRQAQLLLQTAGCVVLRDVLPLPQINKLTEAFNRIFRDCIDSKQGDSWYQVSHHAQAVFWERAARWRIFPKLRPPFDNETLLANPLIIDLIEDLLGPDLYCKFVSSDTCVRGSTLQAPHRELSAGGAPMPCAYIVNVPLTTCGLDNGPIEVWPVGSHLWRTDLLARFQLSDDVQDGMNPDMETFASLLPSCKLQLEPGSILIRDPGMLHRGTPNRSDAPRTMLTICYMRRGHSHDYGSLQFNVDDEIYSTLSPAVRRIFAANFANEPLTPDLAPQILLDR
jgi:ectoine hydroxylase-related dioxygenase (phytanoyl-CoA dioxygenase family)